jgi:Tfp pilus assembly protein PilV
MRSTRGFTIIEALVALLILDVGILGLATTTAVVTRMIRQGRAASEAAALAHARLEVLRSEGCGPPSSGAETRPGATVRWTVDVPPFPRARVLRVRVQRATARGLRADTITAVLLCP